MSIQRPEVNKCCWKNGTDRLAQHRVATKLQFVKNTVSGAFPGGTVVENLPANSGDMGSGPGLGGSRVPRSGWAREPQLLSLRVWSLCSAAREAAMVGGDRKSTRLNSSH